MFPQSKSHSFLLKNSAKRFPFFLHFALTFFGGILPCTIPSVEMSSPQRNKKYIYPPEQTLSLFYQMLKTEKTISKM
jgi:hypothetical protein